MLGPNGVTRQNEICAFMNSIYNNGFSIPADLNGDGRIEHSESAVDFESESELAEEDEEDSARNELTAATSEPCSTTSPKDIGHSKTRIFEQGMQVDNMQHPRLPGVEQSQQTRETQRPIIDRLKRWYPSFEPHKVLPMNKLFAPECSEIQSYLPHSTQPLIPADMKVDVESEQSKVFLQCNPDASASQVGITSGFYSDPEKENSKISSKDVQEEISSPYASCSPPKDLLHSPLEIEIANWDSVLNAGGSCDINNNKAPRAPSLAWEFYEDYVYASDDERAILNGEPARKRASLSMKDPHLLFVEDCRPPFARLHQHSNTDLPTNVSNDRTYELLNHNYQHETRFTTVGLQIRHSAIALRLQAPFYRLKLTKQQLRNWHRPKFEMIPGRQFHISNLEMCKDAPTKNSIPSKSEDLTLGDNSELFLFEYSEECPILLSGTGMGSKLVNYYRQKSIDDKWQPALRQGESHILSERDNGPFWNFGFVDPGKIVQTLYNQLVRAPVFQHEPQLTDFLVIKSSTCTRGSKMFLRPIQTLFTVGQVFPVAQVPEPTSRKLASISKNRFKMAAYRSLNKDSRNQLRFKDISLSYSKSSNMLNRQCLNRFMKYHRSGKERGYWKLKPGERLLSETEIQSMLTPEDAVLLESSQVGQQQLQDLKQLYKLPHDDKNTIALEQRLSPWIISKNFIDAVHNKTVLQLNGPGDPTARGEGFSMIREAIKSRVELCKKHEPPIRGHPHKMTSRRKMYHEEIKRIWYAQSKALTVTNPKELTDADQPPEPLFATAVPDPLYVGQVLQITRLVRDENGTLLRDVELIYDPLIIGAYMNRRNAN